VPFPCTPTQQSNSGYIVVCCPGHLRVSKFISCLCTVLLAINRVASTAGLPLPDIGAQTLLTYPDVQIQATAYQASVSYALYAHVSLCMSRWDVSSGCVRMHTCSVPCASSRTCLCALLTPFERPGDEPSAIAHENAGRASSPRLQVSSQKKRGDLNKSCSCVHLFIIQYM
jgi:hypothetical protein